MSAFDHWKQILRIFSHASKISDSTLNSIIPILYFQMKTIPEDFMVDIVSSNNVVLQCLNKLLKNVHLNPSIRKREHIRHYLSHFPVHIINSLLQTASSQQAKQIQSILRS